MVRKKKTPKSKLVKIDKEKRFKDLEADYKKWKTHFVDNNGNKLTRDEYMKKFGDPFKKEVK